MSILYGILHQHITLIVVNIFYHSRHLHHFISRTIGYFLLFPDAVERRKLGIKIQHSSARPQLNQSIFICTEILLKDNFKRLRVTREFVDIRVRKVNSISGLVKVQ